MIDIYICEDVEQEMQRYVGCVQEILAKGKYNMKLALATTDPHEALNAAKNSPNKGLYFLDIDLVPGMDGFKLALEIHTANRDNEVVFLTSHSELTLAAFALKTKALDFIPKSHPDIAGKIRECIEYIHSDAKTFSLGDVECKTDSILCFVVTSKKNNVRMHKKHGTADLRTSIRELSGKLDDDFFLCHRSCIVNIKNIDREAPNTKNGIDYNNSVVCLANGMTCPLSKGREKELEQRLSENV